MTAVQAVEVQVPVVLESSQTGGDHGWPKSLNFCSNQPLGPCARCVRWSLLVVVVGDHMEGTAKNAKIDMRRSRLSRAMISEAFTIAARNRGSLELQMKNGPVRQTLEIVERLKNGDTQMSVVDYDGCVVSERTIPHNEIPLREFSRKPTKQASHKHRVLPSAYQ